MYPSRNPSPVMIVLAFAAIYIVWGSTFFFIRIGVQEIPPMLFGAARFFTAGLLMLLFCLSKGEKIFKADTIKPAAVSGLIMLFINNGSVIWIEQMVPSFVVAIAAATSPIWMVIFDKPQWKQNFTNPSTIAGLIIGLIGVVILFQEQLASTFSTMTGSAKYILPCMLILIPIAWATGSIFTKYKSISSSVIVNSAWQMIVAGIAFSIASLALKENRAFHPEDISNQAWLALIYLIFMGSIVSFSAYVWLLQVRPATQVSTHAYVNPVVAVLLGVFFGSEEINGMQIIGLSVILGSVLLINLIKYRNSRNLQP